MHLLLVTADVAKQVLIVTVVAVFATVTYALIRGLGGKWAVVDAWIHARFPWFAIGTSEV